MFVIRREQMQALNPQSGSTFREAVLDHLATADPVKFNALGTEGASALIRRGIEQAASFGIGVESDVFDFIDMLFEEGEDFLSRPSQSWAMKILDDRAASGTERMSRITAWREALRPVKRAEAARGS